MYYTAPTDEIFEEVKAQAIKLWVEVDTDNNRYGYATNKINRIKDLHNVKDNVMYIIAMFDSNHHIILASMLTEEAKSAIDERIISGGNLTSAFK